MSQTDHVVQPSIEGEVLLPLALPDSVCLRVQALTGPASEVSIKPKCVDGLVGCQHLAAAMGQGARMARLVESGHPTSPRNTRLELGMSPKGEHSVVAAAEGLGAWVAAAGALADRISRGLVLDWGRHTVLLAGMDLTEEEPGQWGRLHPLSPAVEAMAVSALEQGPVDAAWADAMVVLPGDEERYSRLRSLLAQRWPRAKVCTADSLAALTGIDGNRRRPRTGEVWFPLVASSSAELKRLRVMVVPWQRQRGEEPPVDVIYKPSVSRDASLDSLAKQVRQTVRAWRDNEHPAAGTRWASVVQLPADLITADGASYELALCLADRMARGREWPGTGRVLATGKVDAQHRSHGAVETVSGTLNGTAGKTGSNHKLDALLSEARDGDVVLLPDHQDWRRDVAVRLGSPDSEDTHITARGARVMFVRQVLPP